MKFSGLQNTFNASSRSIQRENLVFVQLDLFQIQSNQSEYGAELLCFSLCSVLKHPDGDGSNDQTGYTGYRCLPLGGVSPSIKHSNI